MLRHRRCFRYMFSPKKFTLPQLAACVLLSFYFKMSYRDFEKLLLMSKELRDALELTRVPRYSTLNRMYHRFRASHLDKMNETLLSELNKAGLVQEEVIAVDSTGFRPTNASAYFQTRRGKPFRYWLYAVGVNSQMILAVTHATGPSNDARHLAGLKRRASRSDERGHPAWVMLADSDFDSAKIGPRDIIPPIRRGGNLKAAQRKARAELVSHARLDGLFGQR